MDRVFLGWNQPCLPVAADYLAQRFAAPGLLDLQSVLVAVPGGRAGRRLLEILVQRSEEQDLTFFPPTILTVGRFPERLYPQRRPFADEFTQHLVWAEALRRARQERINRLTPASPAADDLMAWLALGEMLGRLHRELAADGLDFSNVVDAGSALESFTEADRWQALAEIQKDYLRRLDALGLWDLQTARVVAIRQGECKTDETIVLVGTVDLNRAQRLMLDQVSQRVTALVFAPQELAGRFDGHGCLVPKAWQETPIELAPEQIRIVGDPAEQAAAAVRTIAALEGRYSAEEITLGVPDEEVAPHLVQQLAECGIPARYGPGTPIAQTGPLRLLRAVADHLETGRFSTLAAIARDPALQERLAAEGIHDDWLSEMDEYYREHLPPRLDRYWLETQPGAKSLKRMAAAVETLLAPLASDARRGFAHWGRAIVHLLVDVFGHAALDRTRPGDRTVLAACQKIRDALQQMADVPAALAPQLTAAETLRLVLRELSDEIVPPPVGQDEVELLGWLELLMDDAPALVVTGMNEGRVPTSLNADLFLPNRLRQTLGIEDNDRRYARDAYALAAIAASRPSLAVIAGRRTAAGDPLAPSRLLLACDEPTIARRMLQFLAAGDASLSVANLPRALRPGRTQSAFEIPRPEPLSEPVASMRVTEFRDYLACPYRYYLRHRLGLAGLDDAAEELDGAAFGSLAHRVLREFGLSEAAPSTDAEAIRAELDAALDRGAVEQYGDAPSAAVRVQVEQLRQRLAAFAHWQAGWAAQGWRIAQVEVAPADGQAVMRVDGRAMALRGRIDRIDRNERTGRWYVFDYKTSDKGQSPEQTHRRKGQWIDLQLPLYRHLLPAIGVEQPEGLGYIVLPKDTGKVGALPAAWTKEDLQSADRAAEEVIRRVWAERFWPPTVPPPPFAEEFSAICLDGQLSALPDDEVEEGGEP